MQKLVDVLARHDPEQAGRVRGLLSGPEPDGVLLLGPDVASVGQLAMTLAAALSDLVVCAPVDGPSRPSLLARTRAVVWVWHAAAPSTEAQWDRLREVAGQVDEVHLALAGTEAHHGWREVLARDRRRLAEMLPRLAAHPVHLLSDGPEELRTALSRRSSLGSRNALRALSTDVDELLTLGERRQELAVRHELAVEEVLRLRRAELAARCRGGAGEWPKRVRAELAAVRLAASGAAADGLRRLREEAVAHLERVDRAGRQRFPARFAVAVGALADQLDDGLDAALRQVERTVYADTGSSPVPFAARWRAAAASSGAGPGRDRLAFRVPAPGGLTGGGLEERLVLLAGVSGGLGLGRLALSAAGPLDVLAAPLAVGLGVAVACGLARARRASRDRARLSRWVGEVLAGLCAAVQAQLAERLLRAERRLSTLLDGVAASASAELDLRVRQYDVADRRIAARRAERSATAVSALVELRWARVELDRLLTSAALTSYPTSNPTREVA
ncbi:MAG TPA: hypothetical protein VGM60_09955 [Pseudonocardia sp.]|uniref:hypothetical protein n=1 Tax=Pseudonocardia sp. TaxID=60912 RepID=UPI002F4203E5